MSDETDDIDTWTRVGGALGSISAAALLVGTGLYLLDVFDVLSDAPELVSTPAGFERDLADYYAAWFAHQREILWSIALREFAFLIAFTGLALLIFAAGRRLRWSRPSAAVAPMLFGAGSVLRVAADFVYLGNASAWRQSGWRAEPTSNMIAAGRAAEAIASVSDALEACGYCLLLAGVVALIFALRQSSQRSMAIERVALLQAAGLLALIVALVTELDLLNEVGGALSGVIGGPALALLLGRFVARPRQPLAG